MGVTEYTESEITMFNQPAAADRTPRRPLAELHLHLEGTLEPEAIFELARANDVPLPYSELAELRARYEFGDLGSFLALYYENMAVLQTRTDFAEMTWRYAVRAARAGVRHTEVFIDPQAHTARGVAASTLLAGVQAGLHRAERELDLSSGIIVCVLRDKPVDDARRMLDEAMASEVPLLGIGLDSAEAGYPPELFADVFAAAGSAGLHKVAHAGEEGPPDYIWQAIDVLGVERIDHGVRCLEDDALVTRLVSEQVPLTVCPLSNVRLQVIDELANHPLPAMLERGLNVCLNSDDPAYFGGYLDDNVDQCESALELSMEDLDHLAANSIRSSFADQDRKAQLLGELAAYRS